MGRDLMTLNCFRESIMRSDSTLRPYGINLLDLLMDSKEDTFKDTVSSFVSIVGIQVTFYVSGSRNRVFMFSVANRPGPKLVALDTLFHVWLKRNGFVSLSDKFMAVAVIETFCAFELY